MSRLLFLSEVSWAGMSWEPTEVKHCIYVSIYRFHSLMHDLYRPAQVCTIFYHWFKSKKYKYVKSTWNTPCLRKKHFQELWEVKTLQKKSAPNSERNNTLQKTNRYIAAWYLRPIYLDLFASNGLLLIALVNAVKEKKKAKRNNNKKRS